MKDVMGMDNVMLVWYLEVLIRMFKEVECVEWVVKGVLIEDENFRMLFKYFESICLILEEFGSKNVSDFVGM